MQDRPICFQCAKPVETNAEMIFESPCGHEECASAVFHPLCLFDWRERRSKMEQWIAEVRERWMNEHEQRKEEE